jgi:glycosyltransferase involved in cell wall biosynthesis
MPHIIISTSNDISTDNRVHKVAMVLLELGYDVLWLGRELPDSQPLHRPYKTKRFLLKYTTGALFYANLNIRLFWFLLFAKADVLLSNDLDTLWANRLVSRLRGKKLVYDTHEYFLGVPEIQNRPLVKWVWRTIERSIFPKLRYTFTVNESIADLYLTDYVSRPKVFRNISMPPVIDRWKSRSELGLPDDKFIFINQGSGMNVDRGLEESLTAIAQIDGALLLLVGSGDAIPLLKEDAKKRGLEAKVKFIDRVPYEELLQYTHAADVGLSLDKDNNINYKYSLPNKLFDYIYCQKPVLVSRVVEVAGIVKRYKIGMIAADYRPETIANLMIEMMAQGDQPYQEALQKAAQDLNWEKEKRVLVDFYSTLKKEITHG